MLPSLGGSARWISTACPRRAGDGPRVRAGGRSENSRRSTPPSPRRSARRLRRSLRPARGENRRQAPGGRVRRAASKSASNGAQSSISFSRAAARVLAFVAERLPFRTEPEAAPLRRPQTQPYVASASASGARRVSTARLAVAASAQNSTSIAAWPSKWVCVRNPSNAATPSKSARARRDGEFKLRVTISCSSDCISWPKPRAPAAWRTRGSRGQMPVQQAEGTGAARARPLAAGTEGPQVRHALRVRAFRSTE